jgi:hypothetical protein
LSETPGESRSEGSSSPPPRSDNWSVHPTGYLSLAKRRLSVALPFGRLRPTLNRRTAPNPQTDR